MTAESGQLTVDSVSLRHCPRRECIYAFLMERMNPFPTKPRVILRSDSDEEATHFVDILLQLGAKILRLPSVAQDDGGRMDN